jgi:hypothetical protein
MLKYTNVIIVNSVLLLLVLGCANTPEDPSAPPKPVEHVSISARELSANYFYNYEVANNDFKGKILTVSEGRINDVSGSSFDIQGTQDAAVIRVYLRTSKLGKDWVGKRVNVTGLCTGGSALSVWIEDAEIVK